MGTLMKKMTRHDTASTNQPPTNGPAAATAPPKPDHRPTARARSAGAMQAEMMARLPGVSSAPPTPWRARAAMSTTAFGANPHTADAARWCVVSEGQGGGEELVARGGARGWGAGGGGGGAREGRHSGRRAARA